MNILSFIIKYPYIIVLIVFSLVGLVCLAIYKIQRVKVRQTQEDTTDYSNYPKSASVEFVSTEDVKDDMQIEENGTKFTMGIQCFGHDYHLSAPLEQQRVQGNYIGLFNMIDSPLQYHKQCQAVDIQKNIDNYDDAINNKEKVIKRLSENINNFGNSRVVMTDTLNSTYTELKGVQETEKSILADTQIKEEEKAKKMKEIEQQKNNLSLKINDIKDNLCKIDFEVKKLEVAIENARWGKKHLLEQKAYGKAISSSKEEPQNSEYYLFSYYYDKNSYGGRLSQEEIIKRAHKHLVSKVQAYIAVLRRCNVEASIITSEEIKEILRRSYNPLSADEYKMRTINENSNFYEAIVQSNSFEEKKIEVRNSLLKNYNKKVG